MGAHCLNLLLETEIVSLELNNELLVRGQSLKQPFPWEIQIVLLKELFEHEPIVL